MYLFFYVHHLRNPYNSSMSRRTIISTFQVKHWVPLRNLTQYCIQWGQPPVKCNMLHFVILSQFKIQHCMDPDKSDEAFYWLEWIPIPDSRLNVSIKPRARVMEWVHFFMTSGYPSHGGKNWSPINLFYSIKGWNLNVLVTVSKSYI